MESADRRRDDPGVSAPLPIRKPSLPPRRTIDMRRYWWGRLSFLGPLYGLFAAGALGCAGTGSTPAPTPSVGTSFALVQQVLDGKCTSCHGTREAAAGLRLDTWDNLVGGSSHGEAMIPFNPDQSRLIRMVTSLAGGPHPVEQGQEALTATEVATIRGWIDDGGRDARGRVPHAGAAQLLYVCNQDDATVSVIDMETRVVTRVVDLQALGFSANAKPHHTAVEPDGSYWYVSLIAEGKVLKFNRANELVAQVDFEVPGLLALHSTEDLLFVGRSMAAVNPPQRIGVIRRSDMSLEEIDVFFPRPHALAIDRMGEYVYSGSLAENRFASVNRNSDELEFTVVDGPTHVLVQFAVSPVSQTMVVGGQLTGKLFVFDITNPAVPAQTDVIDVAAQPWHPVYSSDGRMVYIGNKAADAVTVIDMSTRQVSRVIRGRGLAEPHGAALSADDRWLFVSNNNLKGAYTPRHDFGDSVKSGTVVVIDTRSGAIEKVLEVGRYASGVSTRVRQ